MPAASISPDCELVAPCAGAWIEIVDVFAVTFLLASLPARERGLKCTEYYRKQLYRKVAPCAGAWIEIARAENVSSSDHVAPCAGAWIEILHKLESQMHMGVAPCAGAWIEIFSVATNEPFCTSRSLRGSVD